MVQVSYPGVYVQEIPSGVRTITGVATSIAMFVGFTGKGPLNQPTLLFSFADFERAFGEPDDPSISELGLQVRQFFQNGGQQCYVMRIAEGAAASQVDLLTVAKTDSLRISAKNEGSDGNLLRIDVDYDTPRPDDTFNLRVFRVVEVSGSLVEQEVEAHTNLSMDPLSPRYAVKVVAADSLLITADDIAADGPGAGVSIAGQVDDSGFGSLTTTFNTFLNVGSGKKLRASVDGSPFRETAGVTDVANLATAINNAVAADTAETVTVDVIDSTEGIGYLKIATSNAGKTLRIAAAASDDMTSFMQLGVDQGGVEIDGHALRRPAPSAIFSDLGELESTAGNQPMIDRFFEFAFQDEGAVNRVDITDVAGAFQVPVTLGPGGNKMIDGTATSFQSIANARQRLQAIGNAVNSFNNPNFNWRAELQGVALSFVPRSGPANFMASALMTQGGYDFGSNSNFMEDSKENVRYYTLGTAGLPPYQTPGTAGADGSGPTTLSFYEDAYEIIDSRVDIFNLLLLPKHMGFADDGDRATLWGPASTFAQARRAFLLVDPPAAWKNVTDILTGTSAPTIGALRTGLVKDHAAVYWPRIVVVDPNTGFNVNLDPSGSIAGLAARIDGSRGVWKAPAGLEGDIRGITGAEIRISDPENGVINPQAVNAIRVFPNGIVSWGARTMDGFDNSGNDDYKYVPVRRLALFIEESLYRGLRFAVFEPNDEPLWAQIRLAAGAFMNNLFRQGAFQGSKASDAYFVKVDSETTTQNDINLGIVNVLVGFAPLKPAEFVVITIQQKAGQIQV